MYQISFVIDAKHLRSIAVHYHGDSSSYVVGRHHNYEGELFHPDFLAKMHTTK